MTVDFAYDGLRCLEERTTGGPREGEVREYVHGAGLDELLVTHVSGPSGARAYYHHEDVTGSTVALTDGSGTLVDEVAYDEWGVPYFRDAAAHAEAGNQHLFQGHRFDEETGLYYLRARYYDPAKGRFLQRDPMGVWGDPLNLGNPYTFAADNPVTRGDPLGLLTTIQLERGSSSAAEEITKIREARAAHGGSWKFQIGLTFSDPDYMRGVAREKELLGQSDDFLRQVNGVANSWQMDAGLMALSMMPGGGFMVDWTFRLHEYAQTGDIYPVVGGLIEEGMAAAVGMASGGSELSQLALSRMVDEEAAAVAGEFDNCFLAGTNVETASRGGVAVEDVRVGDRIAPPPGHEGCTDSRCGEVVRLFRNQTDQVVTITAAARPRAREHRASGSGDASGDGEDAEPPTVSQTIRCTPGHPFFVEGRGWVFAGDLRAGDELDARGERVVVGAVEVRAERAETFNFEVSCHHTYYVAGPQGQPGVLVHNTSRAIARAVSRLRWKGPALRNQTVYRVIRPDEKLTGLVARNPSAAHSAATHVRYGGRPGFESQFISTTRDIDVARAWAKKTGNRIVEINLGRVRGTAHNLATEAGRARNLPITSGMTPGQQTWMSIARNWARGSQEVLIEGVVPRDAMRLVR